MCFPNCANLACDVAVPAPSASPACGELTVTEPRRRPSPVDARLGGHVVWARAGGWVGGWVSECAR